MQHFLPDGSSGLFHLTKKNDKGKYKRVVREPVGCRKRKVNPVGDSAVGDSVGD